MAAGLPGGMANVNQSAGNCVLNLAQAFDNVVKFNSMLNNAQRLNGATGLEALGFAVSDAGLIVAAYTDLNNLYNVAIGAAGYMAQLPGQQSAGTTNFFWNAQQLLGAQPQ